MNGIQATTNIARAHGSTAFHVASGGASLLPAPGAVGLAGAEDALLVLCAMQTKSDALEVESADTQIGRKKKEIAAHLQKYLDALAAQHAAERDTNGFWGQLKSAAGTVAEIAGVVAGAAAVVASGGAALPLVVGIAAVALSAGGTAVRELKLAGDNSDKIALGMEIAGSVIGVGGCALAALRVGSAAATGTTAFAKTTAGAAEMTSAGATATCGTARVVVASYQHDADEAAADAADAQGKMAAKQREIDTLVRVLTEATEAQTDAVEGTQKAIDGCETATAVAIAGVKG